MASGSSISIGLVTVLCCVVPPGLHTICPRLFPPYHAWFLYMLYYLFILHSILNIYAVLLSSGGVMMTSMRLDNGREDGMPVPYRAMLPVLVGMLLTLSMSFTTRLHWHFVEKLVVIIICVFFNIIMQIRMFRGVTQRALRTQVKYSKLSPEVV